MSKKKLKEEYLLEMTGNIYFIVKKDNKIVEKEKLDKGQILDIVHYAIKDGLSLMLKGEKE